MKPTTRENRRLLLVINESAEVEKTIITIKATVQLETRGCHPRAFVSMIGGNP